MLMKKRIFICLLLVFCFTFILFTSIPVIAQETLAGTQLALRGIIADDAESAVDDETAKTQQTESKESSKESTKTQQIQSKKTVNELPKSKKTDLKEASKEAAKSQQPVSETQVEDSGSKSLEQQVKDLRQEIKKIRDENEARKKLEVPEEEKSQTVEDILSAAGRQYTLMKKGTLGLDYTLGYSYFSSDAITEASVIERRANHNLTNTISAEYALFNNLTMSASIPFCYKYNRVGTASSQDATDLGDITVGLTLQPLKAGGTMPTTIFSLGVSLPTGTSPYEVNQNQTLATGSGYYSISSGLSFSKVIDLLVAFGSLGYSYGLKESGINQYWSKTQKLTGIEPGSSIGLSFGFGYALSYQASLNIGAQFSYSFGPEYEVNNTQTFKSGSSLSGSFNVGTGWRVTAARSIYITLGIGLTNNDSDFSLSFRLPFEF